MNFLSSPETKLLLEIMLKPLFDDVLGLASRSTGRLGPRSFRPGTLPEYQIRVGVQGAGLTKPSARLPGHLKIN